MLTEIDKERIRYHLGYLETSFAASIQLGLPRPLQTVFLLEQSMELLSNQYAIDRCLRILDVLDKIECQLQEATEYLVADTLGNMSLHPLKSKGLLVTDNLEREYVRWANRLADMLGTPLYPFSDRFMRRGPGTSVPVRN